MRAYPLRRSKSGDSSRTALVCQRLPVLLLGMWSGVLINSSFASPQEASYIADVDRQPLEASVSRVVQAMQIAGSPLAEADVKSLEQLQQDSSDPTVVRRLQEILDPYCLAQVTINPESRVKVARGKKASQLDQRGWTNFLIKVVNEAGVTGPLSCLSDQAQPMFVRSDSSAKPDMRVTPADAQRRWLDIRMLNSQPMLPNLSGLRVEYRILQLYSRDRGSREATLSMHVGQGTQDLGFRSDLPILFECRPSVEIPLQILDWDGSPTTCSLLIKDKFGRVYPNPSRRLAPDFFFHEQVYRGDGESIRLAPGDYTIQVFRGPEYHVQTLQVAVDEHSSSEPLRIELRRWIHMAKHGWFSGDHHVHAAGCSHYQNPTEGVTPKDMMRHLLGEDLNVGCVLSWGPCWYYQKEFFDGEVSELSLPGNLMRYDVEVSGFPSSHAGHLCLLNLTEDDYPGTKSIEQWPSWTLPVLSWGKEQGGIVGYSHSGWGLALPDIMPNGTRGRLPKTWGGADPSQQGRAADQLPDYAMPPFDGIGANEFIVATTQGVCDFISAVDTPVIWELNIWYHTLNCGFSSRISGETDFPCIYGERVGLGRSYVQIPDTTAEALQYSDWVEGLRDGRSYVSDGMSHLLSFSVGDFQLGHNDADDPSRASVLALERGGLQTIRGTVAALLPPEQGPSGKRIAARRLDEKPYWHLERSRINESRRVPVELIVNGQSVARQVIVADGEPKDVSFEFEFEQSSWVALRVLPSMHTNPIFVEIDDKPIRASRRSAKWCRDAVDVCWNQKQKQIRQEEIGAAKEAYDQARRIYEVIEKEASID